MSWRGRLGWILAAPVLLILALAVLLVGLLATESGSRWVLAQSGNFAKNAGVSIQFDDFRGNFLHEFRLSRFELTLPGQRIALGELHLRWRPRALLDRLIHIETLSLSDVRYQGEPAPEPEIEPSAPVIPDLALPVGLRLEEFALTGLSVQQGETSLALSRIALGADVSIDKWAITNLSVEAQQGTLSGELGLAPMAPHALDGHLAAQAELPQTGPVQVTAELGGYALRPQVTLAVTNPMPLEASAEADLRELTPRFALAGHWPRLAWPLRGDPQVESLEGELTVEGTPDDYRLTLASQVRGPQVPETRIELLGQGSTQGLRLEPLAAGLLEGNIEVQGELAWAPQVSWDLALSAAGLNPGVLAPDWSGSLNARLTSAGELTESGPIAEVEVERLDGTLGDQPVELTADAQIDYSSAPPRLDAHAHWPRLAWPPTGTPQVESLEGKLEVDGSLDDYRLSLATRVLGPQVPETQVELRGQGSTEALRLEPLTLAMLTGEVQATGALSWAPQIAWDLAVVVDGIDPGGLAPDWPGNVNARLASEGELSEAGPVAQARIERLDGSLRGQPLRASGAFEYRAGRAVARGVDVASGPNRVTLDGEAGEQLALRFSIDAPELAAAYPGLSGAVRGGGKLSGTRESPELDATLEAAAVSYETLQIERLDLSARWQAKGGRVVLEGRDWRAGELQIEEATARLEGVPEAHTLVLDATGPELALGTTARGGWKDELWTGTLQRLELEQALAGAWRLAGPVGLQAGPARAETEELCLVQTPARACVAGSWRAEPRLDLQAKLERLPLERLAPLLPEGLVVEGELNAAAALKGTPERPEASFRIRPGDGRLRVRTEEEPIEIAYRDVRVDGAFADDRGVAEIGLKLGADGVADGRVTLGPAPRRVLDGAVTARFPDLSLISGFAPDLEAVKGRLTADLELAGTLEAPRFEGEVRIANGSARLPAAGLELADLGVAVRGDGLGPLRLEGGVSSGDGRLSLAGTVDLEADPGPRVDLRVQGEDFQAARLPEATVAVSPDLRLAGAEPYRLTGRLLIPSALIEPKTVPTSAVAVSSDEVIVGPEAPEQASGGPTQLDADVRIELGDDVRFKGFGLETRLTGVLDAQLDERGQLVNGKVELKDGAYKAFGQDLTIEQGRLLFAGPPSKPAIDLRAFRVSQDRNVKAYLAVNGPLSKPQTRVYSEPALPDAEALSYLLTGRGLKQADRQEGLDIAAAAFSLGVAQGEPLLQSMSEQLGLDELTVTTGDKGIESSAVTLGKYLNPDLYVGYTQSLFDPAGSVLLRLRLSEHLEVESRAGVQQSVDLFYKLEHD